MAHNDLKDSITVQVKVDKCRFPKSSSFSNIFSEVENKINRKLDRAKSELAPAIGEQLASRDKIAQQMGISILDAIRTGNLFGSITITGGRGSQTVTYQVGTNIKSDYPHYVVYGRGAATAKNFKVMKFTPKGSDTPIYRKRVRPAHSKNYLAQAQVIFEPQISGIVEREVQRVLNG